MVHVAALPTDLLIFYMRTCFDMTMVERLLAAGMSQDCAAETAMWYMAQGDDEGLERYIQEAEYHHALQVLQSKPRSECG